jgi:hypothetical protein
VPKYNSAPIILRIKGVQSPHVQGASKGILKAIKGGVNTRTTFTKKSIGLNTE